LLNGSAPLSESDDDEDRSDDDEDAADQAMLTQAARLSAQASAVAAVGVTATGTGAGGHTRFLTQDDEDALPRPPAMVMGSISGSLSTLRCAPD
jgi:hypothetical protein